MPYVITTTAVTDSKRSGAHVYGEQEHSTRRAVATLEEAQVATWEARARTMQWEVLTEAGGTIGPLPDGTVIEVAERSWHLLRSMVGTVTGGMTDAEIIDAYNARQEG